MVTNGARRAAFANLLLARYGTAISGEERAVCFKCMSDYANSFHMSDREVEEILLRLAARYDMHDDWVKEAIG